LDQNSLHLGCIGPSAHIPPFGVATGEKVGVYGDYGGRYHLYRGG
jgi:hypothetical protein